MKKKANCDSKPADLDPMEQEKFRKSSSQVEKIPKKGPDAGSSNFAEKNNSLLICLACFQVDVSKALGDPGSQAEGDNQ